MLDVRNLQGKRGTFDLNISSLHVDAGEYLVLLGPTGAGKTVFIEYLVGIHRPDRGKIRLEGNNVTQLYPEERGIAYVPQDHALFPNLTVEKNIAYGLVARRVPRNQVETIVSEMLSRLHIEHLRRRMPLHLSGGERQRVALGRALAIRPKLVLLDEPLSALDENLRSAMARDLQELQRGAGATFIHVCHNFEEAADVADRIALLHNGSIVQVGTFKEFLEIPKNEFVARFFKAENVFSAQSDGALLKLNHITFSKKNDVSGPVTIVVRPEHITIIADGEEQGMNCFWGTVVYRRQKPYFLETGVDIGVFLTVYASSDKRYSPGDSVQVHIPEEKIILMGYEKGSD